MRRFEDDEMIVVTPRQYRFASAVGDILVYLVVLNLWVEFAEEVIIDSFAVSILTAVLLWVMLQLIEGLAHRVGEFFSAKPSRLAHVIGWVSVLTILFASKFLIIAVVGAVFGDSAVLGHFVEVILIVLTMMIARAVVDQVYQRLGGVREPLRLSDFADAKPPSVHIAEGDMVEVG